ncbi:hypothetical protein PAEPH01_0690 [Pancytospora epiphaga]|nr:hypothetical protein PAEPH01_0690 [Pancytospora epiphaga]
MVLRKYYRAIYTILCISIFVILCSASNLKRELETSESDVCKAKRVAYDTNKPYEYLQEHIPEIMDDNSFSYQIVEEFINNEMSMSNETEKVTDQNINTDNNDNKNKSIAIKELVADMIQNEKNLIPNNFQPHNITFKDSEGGETSLSNNQATFMKEEPLITLNAMNNTLNLEENSIQQQPDGTCIYSYSNTQFLFLFLYLPSANFTIDSLRTRFGTGFLNFLSTDQLIRVLITLLERNLRLTKVERSELVEMIFGYIDFSLKMKFNNNQIVSIVTELMLSDVPHCFEQVFLTWKMWKVFTIEEQEQMLKNITSNIEQVNEIKMKYEKETLVMLYLFVLNKDAANSCMCEILKKGIVKIYGKTQFVNVNFNLDKYIKLNFPVADILDTSLLDLPNILKNYDNIDLSEFKEFIRQTMRITNGSLRLIFHGRKYKIHTCYVFTKFTQISDQNGDKNVNNVYSNLYFGPEYIRRVFSRWSRKINSKSCLVDDCEVKELKNAYGAIRQIVQSEEYNSKAFFKLFSMIYTGNHQDKLFALILFSLTNEDILREINNTSEWAAHIENRNKNMHIFLYIENSFMYNIDPCSNLYKGCKSNAYVKRITSLLFDLKDKDEKMYREYYFYQHLLFHPKFEVFNNSMMKSYIKNLNATGQLDTKERCVQLARDLIFNEYYCESAVELSSKLSKSIGKLKEFGIYLEAEYKHFRNETEIEIERKVLRNC